MSGQRVIDGLKDALAGNLARVTIDGETWTRGERWRPISTAPKDGTEIDLWVVSRSGPFQWREPDCHFDNGWWIQDDGRKRPIAIGEDPKVTPTHWRPLPEPPVTP